MLLLAGCYIWSGGGPAPAPPPEALLEDHVAAIRKENKHEFAPSLDNRNFGHLPPELTVPDTGDGASASSLNATSSWSKVERSSLSFLGVTGDRICFSHTLVLGPNSAGTAAELLEKTRIEEGTWIAFVDSLDALKGPAWPAPAYGTVIDSVELTGDNVETFTRKEDVGGGESINVSHDSRHVNFKLCGPKPSQPASARFMVAVSHRLAPVTTPAWTARTEADLGPAWRGEFARRANAVIAWALTSDGKFDVNK